MATPAQNTVMTPAAAGGGPRPSRSRSRSSAGPPPWRCRTPAPPCAGSCGPPRQWLPPGWFIAAYYWDVESGGLDLEARSQGDAYRQFTDAGIPRDGGMADLLAEAASPSRNSPPSSARTSNGPAATPSTR